MTRHSPGSATNSTHAYISCWIADSKLKIRATLSDPCCAIEYSRMLSLDGLPCHFSRSGYSTWHPSEMSPVTDSPLAETHLRLYTAILRVWPETHSVKLQI